MQKFSAAVKKNRFAVHDGGSVHAAFVKTGESHVFVSMRKA